MAWVYSSLAFNLLKADDGDLHGWKWGAGGPSSAPAPADCVLIFALAGPRTSADLAGFAPNEETSELAVLSAPQPLAFPLHTRVAGEYFARRAKGGH